MNLVNEIIKEHSKRNTIRVANLIGNDNGLIDHLKALTLGLDQEIARNAAWILRAVKCFSIEIAERLTSGRPELINELKLIIEDQFPFASSGFKSRASKLLAKKKTKLSDNENLY